jgi:uncharacterized protein YecA (UPF0149 family)
MAVVIHLTADTTTFHNTITQATSHLRSSMEEMQQKFNRVEQATSRATERMAAHWQRMETTFTRVTRAAVGMAAALARSVVDAGLQMERFERTLQAATSSATEARRAFGFIVTESNRPGQSITAMVPAFAQLTAATKNTVLEGERTRSLFSALAGAGQSVGLSTEAVGRAMVGLIQIISQNAIQLDEFRNQFAS